MPRYFTLADNKTDDIIDIRDIMERVEFLESEVEYYDEKDVLEENEELTVLRNFLEELRGCGGDEQWRGDWYPVALIKDSYFEDYAKQFAEDCGFLKNVHTWPFNCIDWQEAASQLQGDYISADLAGTTYWGQSA